VRGMNAKKIRKAAEQATGGMPLRRYVRKGPRNLTLVLAGCTRAMYQAMKKSVIRGGGK